MSEPTRWTAVVILVLAAAPLAGCLGPVDPDPAPAGEGSTHVSPTDGTQVPSLDTRLENCQVDLGFYEIPMPVAEAMVPDPVRPDGASPGTAALQAWGTSCTASTGERVSEFWIAVVVEPPAAFDDLREGRPHVPLVGWTTSEDLHASYEAAGLGSMVQHTEVTLEALHENPFGWADRVEARGDANAAALTAWKDRPDETRDPAWGPVYLAVEDGEITGAVNVSWPQHEGTWGQSEIRLEGPAFEGLPGASSDAGAHLAGLSHFPSRGDLDIQVAYVPVER